jgi:hypothetical protein
MLGKTMYSQAEDYQTKVLNTLTAKSGVNDEYYKNQNRLNTINVVSTSRQTERR